MRKFFKYITWPFVKIFKLIRRFFSELLLGLLGLVGFDTSKKLEVYFANRKLIQKKASLIQAGSGKFKKGDEVDYIIKNGKTKKISKSAIVVQDQLKYVAQIIVKGEDKTQFVPVNRLKHLTVIRPKSKSKINGNSYSK